MADHSADAVRRELEGTWRLIERELALPPSGLDDLPAEVRAHVDEGRGKFNAAVLDMRRRFEAGWTGRSAGDAKRRDRGSDPGLEPTPVGPMDPGGLSGGAEAPIDA